ncbi:RNA polymerase sigma factor [Brevibacillus formosus]|nr:MULTISPECIES: RNA polymerase sigma factor [Brevibacillus]MED1948622.1 RNA polymerase sigma factor [Brevibacillus formosus]MED2001657.1 RNA polymerase sigma factor [Brevibacillus formosus]MED2085275.1 RNA polymerase sigma factor [Brevibacillus formosus]
MYHAHYQDVYYFLLHFSGNQNDAEDLTQEVFTRVLKGLAGFDGRFTLKTWLFSIAKHAAIDQHRKQKQAIQKQTPHYRLVLIPVTRHVALSSFEDNSLGSYYYPVLGVKGINTFSLFD